MIASSFLDEGTMMAARSVLKAIQEIPSMKHLPVIDRHSRDHDLELENCMKKSTAGLDEKVVTRIRNELFGFGLVEYLAQDESITEILLLGADNVWIERCGRLQVYQDKFLDRLTYRNFVSRLSRDAKTNTDDNRPFANGRWRDFRVHVVSEPVVQGLPHVSLRRIRASPWTLSQLRELNWTDDTGLSALKRLVEMRQNVIVVGATGSGKTSALSACLREISSEERVLILEDTDELPLPTNASVKLLSKVSRSELDVGFDLGDLLKQSLRMRPDRIVMGEVRGAEAKDLLMAFATGHTGCWGTLHAANPREALLRLEMLVQMGAPQWTSQTIRALIHSSIDAIVVVAKASDGKRRLDSIHQVASLEDIGFCFSPLYRSPTTIKP